MKPMAIAGIVLIVLGLAALVYGGINYSTTETIIDVGPLQATAEEQKRFPLPPVAGIAAVGAGVALIVLSSRKRA